MKRLVRFPRIAVAAVVITAVVGSATQAQQVAKSFVFGQSGGASMEASQDIFWKPFTARTGIEIEPLVPSSFGKLRAMVESGNVTASLWDLGSTDVEQATALNLIEKIDWDKVNPGPMFPETKRDYAFGQTYFSTGMAWKKGTTPLENWADFWNVDKFPGKRCLSDFATFTLPLAMLAAGVPKDKLYPLDLDLAFKMLDKIKPNVSVWWNTGSQPAQLLSEDTSALVPRAWQVIVSAASFERHAASRIPRTVTARRRVRRRRRSAETCWRWKARTRSKFRSSSKARQNRPAEETH
jgi:putative spermidine/putrescine transport system substrate-binding protein